MILAKYQLHNKPKSTLSLFTKMETEGIHPDAVAYSFVLAAAADLTSLSIGKNIHNQIKVVLSIFK